VYQDEIAIILIEERIIFQTLSQLIQFVINILSFREPEKNPYIFDIKIEKLR